MDSPAPTMKITDFSDFKRCDAPDLCEIWNWEGDVTVLPGKWASVVNSHYGTDYDSSHFKTVYASKDFFDPNGFFFITYRSNAIGCCLLVNEGNGYQI